MRLNTWQRFALAGLLLVACTSLWCVARAKIPEIPDGYIVIDGDIIVPEDFFERGPYVLNLWPGVVPYEFDANVSSLHRDWAIAAMADWENVANVNFRPRNGDDNYLYIQDSDVNSSQVGMVGGGQVVNIFNWESNFIIVHELGHALGYWHEHQRASRDSYVQIRWGLVEEGTGHNFVIVPEAREYGPYDFDSVMHYGECAFSICEQQCDNFPDSCRTIQVLPPYTGWQELIGQRDHLSSMDALIMSFLYPEGDWRFADAAHVGNGAGTFIDPYQEFDVGVAGTPVDGTLWIQPGTYNAIQGTYSRAMTIRAPLGAVVLQ